MVLTSARSEWLKKAKYILFLLLHGVGVAIDIACHTASTTLFSYCRAAVIALFHRAGKLHSLSKQQVCAVFLPFISVAKIV